MSEHCNHHMHGHQETCGCGCGCKCSSGHHEHHSHGSCGCNCLDNFLELADEAWKEVLKEKIKAKIVAKKGEHLEKLAELIATANGEKWKHKIADKIKGNEFKDNLKEFFSKCAEQQ